MRFKSLLILFLSWISFAASSQKKEQGISFIHGKHWNEIVQKAKKEKKFIFVDCYTTWCGPCKYMSSDVFTDKEVGAFFNKQFVSFKAQIDKTDEDAADIKSLYKDFEQIEATYNIQAYPTFLFFTPEGKIVHRFVGGAEPADFITKAKEALRPETQYYPLKEQLASRTKDTAYLRKMIEMVSDNYEDASPFFNAYAATQTDMFTTENFEVVKKVSGFNQPGFKLIYNNPEKTDAIVGEGATDEYIVNVLNNEFGRKLYADSETTPDAEKVAELEKNYPKYSNRILLNAKVTNFYEAQDWNNFESAVIDYMSQYGNKVTNNSLLNSYAWSLFEHSDNKEHLEMALGWSDKSLSGQDETNAYYLDTYANLLYKLGNKEEAIKYEKKAVEFAETDKESLKETLKKMQKGEKTW